MMAMVRRPIILRVQPQLGGLVVTDARSHAAPFRGRRYDYLSIDRLGADPMYAPLDAVGNPETCDGREVRLSPVNHPDAARRAWQRALGRASRSGRLDVVSRVHESWGGAVAVLAILVAVIAGIVGGTLYIVRWPAWPADTRPFVLVLVMALPITIPLTIRDLPRLLRFARTAPARAIRCTSVALGVEREARPPEHLLWKDLRAVRSSLLGLHLVAHDGRVLDLPRSGRVATLGRLALEGDRSADPRTWRRREKVVLAALAGVLVAAPPVMSAFGLPTSDGTVTTPSEAVAMSALFAVSSLLAWFAAAHFEPAVWRRNADRRRRAQRERP